MHPKKKRIKQRRRAHKLAQQAWDAAEDGNLDLALKIIRRAVQAGIGNPILWNDQGMLLVLAGRDEEAIESFQAAISLAPDFAEAFAHLAAIRVRQDRLPEAVALQQHAVKHAPGRQDYQRQWNAYAALMGASVAPSVNRLADQVQNLDWSLIERELTEQGCTRIREFLDEAVCQTLCEMFDDEASFAKTVKMDKPQFGKGEYRYFRAPLPSVIGDLRRGFYGRLAPIANTWRRLLNQLDSFPGDWGEFHQTCLEAGQSIPTPLLIRYGEGGFNAPHRDNRGDVYFPFQMAVVLNHAFEGGEFVLYDDPVREGSWRCELSASLGDIILFCSCERLERTSDVWIAQPVLHGAAPVVRGTRYVLGVPFHDYR